MKNTQPTILSLTAKASTCMKALHDKALGDLTSAQFRVLDALERLPSGVGHKHLVGETGIDASTLSEMLPRMRSAGLILMGVDPEDRRARLVSITTEGKHVLRRASRSVSLAESRIEREIPKIRSVLRALIEFS